jgi:Prokaryotic membrane lipoprotein lipid attachment site
MKKILLGIGVLLALAGCASTPSGPSVMVLPGTGKNFDQFRADDFECRQYAHAQSGGKTPDQAGTDSGVNTAAVGAVVGAAAGAAIGRSGHAAVAGAGLGTAGGALAGTGTAAHSARTVQGRYDIGFQQCMYAKGHQIPMSGGYRGHLGRSYRQVAPPPPPPAGTPPPPPPRQG